MKMISKIMHACFKVLQKNLIYGQYVNVGLLPVIISIYFNREKHVEYEAYHS